MSLPRHIHVLDGRTATEEWNMPPQMRTKTSHTRNYVLGHARGWCASARTYAIKSIIHIHTFYSWSLVRSMLHSIPFHSNQGTFLHHAYSNIKYSIYINIHLPHQCDTSSHPAPRAPTGTCQEAEGQEPHLTFTAQSIVRCQYLWPRIQDTKYTV